jgi:hypothetical protein
MPPAAPRSMKRASPLDKGGLQGVLGVTHNLLWVVDREAHPGALRPREVFSRLHLRATPPREGIFKGAAHAAGRHHRG